MKKDSNQITETNQFINTSKIVLYEDRENMSMTDDSVLSICPQCNYSTSSIQLLDTHMEQEHGDNISCNISDENRPTKSQLVINPIKQETVDECGILEMKSEFYTNSITDSQSRDGGSPLSSTSNRQVRQISDSRRRYRCNICPVTFPWHGDLAAHLSEVHGFQKASRDGAKTRAGSYKCSYCMYVAKYQSELKRHRRLHMGVKPFGCVFCKYRSAWKGDLKRHIESHHRGHFNSEEELASIMSQYKNNAGTDIKEINEESTNLDGLPSQIPVNQKRDHVNDIISMVMDKTKSEIPMEPSFVCNICNFSTTKEQCFTEHQQTVHRMNGLGNPVSIFNEKQTDNSLISAPVEVGLNLTTNGNSFDPTKLQMNNFNPLNSFSQMPNHQHFHSSAPLGNESLLKAMSTADITSGLTDISTAQQPIPGLIQGMKNELLSVLGSTNNFSFNDFVSRIFSNINGILPPPIITNSLLHPQFIGPTMKSEAFLPVTPMISSPNVLSLNPTSATATGNLKNAQLTSAFHSTVKDTGTSNGEFEFPIPTKPNIFEMEKSSPFKIISGIFSTPKLTSNDIKFKDINNSLINTHQEHWKRFKCSACGHRSNWKWDINKHIKVAHPERDGITTLELSYEDAKSTLQNYLNSTKANKARSHNSFESEEGYYRPYKCSSCGHRSNWKWDVNKHIKQVHQRQAEVITLTMEEAKSTICQYKRRRKTVGLGSISRNIFTNSSQNISCSSFLDTKSGLDSPMENNSSMDNSSEKEKSENTSTTSQITSPTTSMVQSQNPRIDTLRLKRLKCDGCGYRSNYRSDISRHIRRKHDNLASVVFLSDVVLLDYTNNNDEQHGEMTLKQVETVDNENEQSSQISNGANEQINNQQRKLWQCNLCQFSHREKIQVSHHITKNHHPERPFNCKLCQYGTDYRNSLLRHVKAKHKITSIHGVMDQNLSKVRAQSVSTDKQDKTDQQENSSNSTTCLKCGDQFSSYQELFQHMAINHASSDEEVFSILKSKSSEENHVSVSTNYSCFLCTYVTTNPDASQIHQFQHSDLCNYPFRCPHCNYKATSNKFLINHIAGHMGTGQSINSINYDQDEEPEDLSCPKTNLKSIQTFIPNEAQPIHSQKTSKNLSYKIQCHKCSFKTKHRFHLRLHYQKQHRETYRNKTSFKLPKDFKTIFNDNTLSIYKNMDFKSNRFWCDECGYLTCEETQLQSHLMKHMNNNNDQQSDFRCSLCVFSTGSDNELKNHELLHVLSEVSGFNDRAREMNSSLKCDMCNFVTNIQGKLDFHKNFHYFSSGLARFSCPKCNFQHYQLHCFIKHLKYHH